jgi:hypothetical protein
MTGLSWRRELREVTVRFGRITVTIPDNEAMTAEETA